MRSRRWKIEAIAPKRTVGASWGRLGQFLIDFRSQHGPKLAFKVEPKSMKIRSKNRSQIVASWDRSLEGFWWILKGKIVVSWYQNRRKFDMLGEKRILEKRCFSFGFEVFFCLGAFLHSTSAYVEMSCSQLPSWSHLVDLGAIVEPTLWIYVASWLGIFCC